MATPFENPFRETVIARYDHPRDGFCLGIVVEHEGSLENESLLDAMRAAVKDYAATDGGRALQTVRDECFNWGDLVSDLPEEIALRHGFRVADTFVTHLVVEHDEHILL